MVKLKIQAIKPQGMVKAEAYEKALKQAVYKSAALILRDLESTVRTWKQKPTFDVTITEQGGSYAVTAGTDDEIYGYVNDGTRPHAIRPRRARYLRFSSGYKAKTRVGIIGSFQGGAFGSDVFSSGVFHPGFPGRKFTEKIQKRRQVTTRQEIDQSLAVTSRNQ